MMNLLEDSFSKIMHTSFSSTSKVLKARMKARKQDASKDTLQYLPERKKLKLDPRYEIPKKLDQKPSKRTKLSTNVNKSKPDMNSPSRNGFSPRSPQSPKKLGQKPSKRTKLSTNVNKSKPGMNSPSHNGFSPRSPQSPKKLGQKSSKRTKLSTNVNKSKPDMNSPSRNGFSPRSPQVLKARMKARKQDASKDTLQYLPERKKLKLDPRYESPKKLGQKSSKRTKLSTNVNKSKPGMNSPSHNGFSPRSPQSPKILGQKLSKRTKLSTNVNKSKPGMNSPSHNGFSPRSPQSPQKLNLRFSQRIKLLTKANETKTDKPINKRDKSEAQAPVVPKGCIKSTDLTMTNNSSFPLDKLSSSHSPKGPQSPKKLNLRFSQRIKLLTKANESKTDKPINKRGQAPVVPKGCIKSADSTMTNSSSFPLDKLSSSHSPTGPQGEAAQAEGEAGENADHSEGVDILKVKVEAAEAEGEVGENADHSGGAGFLKEKVEAAEAEGEVGENADHSGGAGFLKEKVEAAEAEGEVGENADHSGGAGFLKEKVEAAEAEGEVGENADHSGGAGFLKEEVEAAEVEGEVGENADHSGGAGFLKEEVEAAEAEGEVGENADHSGGAGFLKEKVEDWPDESLLFSDDFLTDNSQEEYFSGETTFDFETGKDNLPANLNINQFVEDMLTAVGSALDLNEKVVQQNQHQEIGRQILAPQFAGITCAEAPKFFTLNVPLARVQEVPKMLCSVCQEHFTNIEELYKHKLLNHLSKVCNVCFKIVPNVRALMQHVSKKHELHTMCPECFLAVETNSFYNHSSSHSESTKKVHERIKNNPSMNPLMNIEKLKCRACFQIFGTREEVKKHEKQHINSFYTCKICGDLFLTKLDLHKHGSETHLAIKRSICIVCHLDFPDNSSLSRHLRLTHNMMSNQTPHRFECICCHHQFGNKIKFIQHMQYNHRQHDLVVRASQGAETGTAKSKCPYCSKFFKNANVRAVHEIIFHEAPPYKCNCNEGFFTKATFDEHILKHTRIALEHMIAMKKKRSKKSF